MSTEITEPQRYTREEVKRRDGKIDKQIWIIYKDSIYDVTNYIHEHPAGDAEILEEAGKDATKAFKDAGHSRDALKILGKLKIGEVVDEEKRYDANGKKLKVASTSEETSGRSCLNIITCGLLG